MRKRTGVGLRTWVLGAAATGLLSLPVAGQSKNSAPSNTKAPLSKPAPATTPVIPVLLPVPTEDESSANFVLPASQVELAANEKSEVQRQLELLYEKDGREMPDLKVNNLQPLRPANALQQAAPQTATIPAAKAVQTTPSAAQQQQSRSATGYTKYQPAAARSAVVTNPPQLSSPPAKNYVSAIAAQKPVAAPSGQSANQVPVQATSQPRQNRVTGFFKRLMPSSNKASTSTPPIPPDYVNSVPDVPPASAMAGGGMPTVRSYPNQQSRVPTTPMTTKPSLSPVPLQSNPIPLIPYNPISIGLNPSRLDVPQPTLGLPELAQEPLPLLNDLIADTLPPLMTEPDSRTLLANSKLNEVLDQIPATGSDFPNPFPEENENQADLTNKSKPEAAAIVIEDPVASSDPKLSDDGDTSIAIPSSEEDPFAVRKKDFAESTIDERIEEKSRAAVPELTKPQTARVVPNALDVAQTDDAGPAIDPLPPAPPMPELSGPSLDVGALKPPEEAADAYLEKMRRIRERFGMKGLKGFCPVTLRDERELLDAKPEYFHTHRGQKFHFTSAEARDKFIADPSVYAPAAYGADVVALGRDKDVVEGTLDFAAWFKGRLYLFGSQANYEVFVKSPLTYAGLAGIE